MGLVLEAGGLSREDDDHVPPKDALCLWRGMLELAPVGMSTTTRLVLISLSASSLPSGFTEPSGFWFQSQCPCGLAVGLSGSSPIPRAALSAVFHELPPFTKLKEKRSLPRAVCRKALMHSLQGHVSDLPDFSAGGGGG